MRCVIAPLVLLFSLAAWANPSALADLSSLKWSQRIILVNEPPEKQGLLALFEQHKTQVQHRDIRWFIFTQQQIFTNYSGSLSADFVAKTRAQYQLKPGKIMLIGKDGGVKFLLDKMDLAAIFAEIDAMPMRQAEMAH